jgi:hypothetical protein
MFNEILEQMMNSPEKRSAKALKAMAIDGVAGLYAYWQQ